MLGLLGGMLALLVFVDIVDISRIVTSTTREENRIVIDEKSMYITTAQNVVTLHVIFIGITALLLITLPLYSKAIKKIKPSIDVEGNENLAALDIDDDDR